MNKKFAIPAGTLLLLALIAAAFSLGRSASKPASSLSPHILYLTSPAAVFSGKIETIDGNTLTVSQTMSAAAPTPAPAKITFRVLVTAETPVNYSSSLSVTTPGSGTTGSTTSPRPLTTKDLRAGQAVIIDSATDLRTNTSGTFTATAIRLNGPTSLHGTIIARQGDILSVKGFADSNQMSFTNTAPPGPEEKIYRVKVVPDTAISQNLIGNTPPGPGSTRTMQPEKLSAADLRPDMQITVWTSQDVSLDPEVAAVRISVLAAPSSSSNQ